MNKTQHIHWIGAGLASGPGLVGLASEANNVTIWDMTGERATMLQAHMPAGKHLPYKALDLNDQASVQSFKEYVAAGDIIVSMLPAFLHVTVAKIALEVGAHLATSSYVDPAMADLHVAAKDKGLAFVNEVGLDPGIDHLFAHVLVDEAEKAGVLGKGNKIEFVSHCGGIPAEKTDFTYKFSWTPYGVLKALTNPAHCIEDGKKVTTDKVWQSVSDIEIAGETFEVYPNRDSLPYVAEYGLEGEENLQSFVRGTLRQAGWKHAWADIFTKVETITDEELKELSGKLWQDYHYEDDEEDRVILYVALAAKNEAGETLWSASLALDEVGSGWQSAMARTVSLTVAEAVKAIGRGYFTPGVHAALAEAGEAKKWLRGLKSAGVTLRSENLDV